MKIVCDACGAKYAIADDKVRGKVFKIRCKKCSNVIVVRGTTAEMEQQQEQLDPRETRTFDYAGYDNQAPGAADHGAVWHLVIDQEQIGPISDAEVRQRFAAGEIDRETYAWREGFSDWLPLGEIDTFADLGAGGDASADDDAPTQMFADPGGNGAQAHQDGEPGADLFAASAGGAPGQEAGGDLFAGAAGADSGDNLFGDDNGAVDDASARRLRGERNENSVLFSLNNLAALAADSPKPAAAAPAPEGELASPGAVASGAPGAAPLGGNGGGGDGSGLIDIRSMAKVYLEDDAAAPGGQAMGPAMGPIEPLAIAGQSAVLLPTTQPASSNKTMFILAGGIGALLVAAVLVVVVVLKDDPPPTPVAAAPGQNAAGQAQQPAANAPAGAGTAAAPGAAVAANTATNSPTPGSPSGAGTTAGAGTGAGTAASDPNQGTSGSGTATTPASSGDTTTNRTNSAASRRAPPKPRRPRASSTRSGSASTQRSDDDKKTTPKRNPEPKKSAASSRSGKCLDEVGCLLADKPPACCAKYSGGGKSSRKSSGGGSSGSKSNLPERLSRGDITSGINKVRGRVRSCGSKHSGKGQVKVTVKVGSSGAVSGVTIKSAPNAGLGKCVASAVKRAKFAKSQKGASFTYPFVF